jgi:hypothetical protein
MRVRPRVFHLARETRRALEEIVESLTRLALVGKVIRTRSQSVRFPELGSHDS